MAKRIEEGMARPRRSAAEVSARADAALQDFLSNADSIIATPPPTPALARVPQGTLPPPTPAPKAEVLVAADTVLTPNPLLGDEDQIELIEESGLLTLEPDGSNEVNAIEVSSRFLIDEEENEVIVQGPAPTQTVEEIASEYLAYVEAQGEISKNDEPLRPISDGPSVDIANLHQEALSNDSAEYSDGIPLIRRQSHGISSKTLRVPAPKKSPLWIRRFALASVFAAGIGVGIGFALTQSESSPAETKTETAPAAQAAASDEAAELPEPTAPVVQPIVQPLDLDEAEQALVADEEETLDDETLDDEEESQDTAEALDALERELEGKDEPALEPTEDKKAREPRSKRRAKKAAINAAPTPAAADPGVLMLAAKPPSQIRIDGKTTGLTTPQRVLRLSPGKHRITLINSEHKIRDSFKVSIISGQKTRIVRDNTSKIK